MIDTLGELSGNHSLLPLLLQMMILILAVWIDPFIRKKQRQIMFRIILLVLSFIGLNLFSTYLVTYPEMVKPTALVRTIESVYGYSARPVILLLAFYILDPDKNYKPFWCLVGVNAAIYMTSFWGSRVAFFISADNLFYRGPLGWSAHVTGAILLLKLVALSLREVKRVRKAEALIPILNALLLTGAVAIDSFIVRAEIGLSYLTITMVSCCLSYYIWLHLKFVRDHEDALMMEQRVKIMRSQIQPHFLYNSLTVIQDLCHTNPARAEDATVQFSKYLRGNMDSLCSDAPIPFAHELAHTRAYLELEKMCSEGALRVRYDISCQSFQLPVLTLQPIVENAVRHGVRCNSDGRGEVMISTLEHSDRYEITVTDNGPGFDPSKDQKDGEQSHIGIQNVRDRLERMCGGTLRIQSAPGEGTIVTITLPKEAKAI